MVLDTKPKRSPSISHRKRTGQHHKQTKRYTKTYWPYLPLLVVVVLGIAANSLWAHVQHGVLGYATDMSASALLSDTNSQRIQNGEAALSYNAQLTAAAQAKANDMATRNYWSHNTPDGATPWTFIINAGYSYQAAGENLAYGFDTSNATITGWMNSAEHRANILNTRYADVGFGIANAADYQGTGPETIVVAMYGQPPAAAPAPVASSTPTAKATPAPAASTPAPAPTPAPTPAPAAAPTDAAKTPTPAKQQTTVAKANVGTTPAASVLPEKHISRIQLVSNGAAPWSAFAASTLAAMCVAFFLLRHGLAWHRVLRKGERFMVKYHLLDVLLVGIGVLGFVLTRTAGTIH